MQTNQINAGVYLRISPKPDENREVLAIERQQEDCLKVCKAQGWTPHLYIDQHVSATSRKKRPAFERLKVDMAKRAIQAVVVYDLDRLIRKPAELEEFITLADVAPRIELATVGGDVNLGDHNGRLFARMKGIVAKHEMESKAARHKREHEQRRDGGRPWAARRPYGFLSDAISHHPTEADTLRQMYVDLLSGIPQTGICEQLNAAGSWTSMGNPWKQSSLRQLLLNPRNAGYCTELVPVPNKTVREIKIVGKAVWEPIVSEDVWQAARAKILSHPQIGGKSRMHLLSGLMTCGLCGARMATGYVGRKGATVRHYHCSKCNRVSRNAQALDTFISKLIIKRMSQPDAAELIIDHNAPNATALRVEINALRLHRTNLAKMLGAQELDHDEWRIARTQVDTRLAEIEAARAHSDRASLLKPLIDGDANESWDAMPLDWRRLAISGLLKIVVNPTRKGVRFRKEDIAVEWSSWTSPDSMTALPDVA